MINCNTFVIQNKESALNGLNIGGVELLINEDGTIKTKDKDGNETIIGESNGNAYGTLKHLEINITDTRQILINDKETQLIFDEDFEVGVNDIDFSVNNIDNSISILSEGHFFISFSITLDMYSSNKTTVGAYVKIDDGVSNETLSKSQSYLYFQQSTRGYGSINNSFIYDGKVNDKITIYLKTKEGTGKFYTVPESTNFNIFKIL